MTTTYRIIEVPTFALLREERTEDGKAGGCVSLGRYDDKTAAEEVRAALESLLALSVDSKALGAWRGTDG
jgi:hypothetical protein